MPVRVRKLMTFAALTTGALTLQPLPASAAAPPTPRLVTASVPASDRTVEAPATFDLAGVSYDGPAGADVELRASDDGKGWTPWTDLGDASAEGPDRSSPERSTRRVTQPVWTGAARYVQVRVAGAGAVRDVQLHGVDVKGHGESLGDKVRRALKGLVRGDAKAASAMTDQPQIITRAEWGADESIRRAAPSYGTVRFAVLHHTVNANDYSEADAPALIRGIYVYHVKTNGWNDIGYNFLVDRFGNIYEGRYGGIDRPVIGAHAEGFNSYSTGVAMLGTFTSVTPPPPMLDAVKRLMAWRLDVAHVDPLGTATVVSKGSSKYPAGTSVTVKGIVGHRDLGTTSCPGDLGYAQLDGIRTAVSQLGLPKIYSPAASPSTIEGRQKTSYASTTVTASASEPLAWTATIDSDRTGVVKVVASAGDALSFTWDGTDDSGANVPAGTYHIAIAGTGPSGEARGATVDVQVVDLDLLKPVNRLAGDDRYGTAAAAADQTAPSAGPNVVIAAGESAHLVDSLVAAPLTKAKSAPLLLTSRTSLPAATVGELDRLKPTTAWLVGGVAAIGVEVESSLRDRGITVKRLAGATAPETAAAVADEVGGGHGGVVVVSGDTDHLVDGLAAAGPAAGLQRPVLLVSRDSVPDATQNELSSLGGGDVWAVGGQAAISDAVVQELKATRVAGADRWATATAVADAGKKAGVTVDTVIVASGEAANLVDALAGGSFAEAVVLSARSSLPAATQSWLTGNRSLIKKAFVLGGPAAVGDGPLEDVRSAINQP